jgi:transposase
MKTTDIIRMSIKEVKRLSVIDLVKSGQIRQRKGAQLLGLSARQVRRLVRRVREEGPRGLVHRSRGRPSNRKTAPETRERVLKLCRGIYEGFGPTLASEKLAELDGILISPETLRLWFIEEEITYRRRKKRPHRQWRERKQHCGELVQMDGSHHDWLEDRGPQLVLMGYIDDATGRVFARFYDYEGTLPALDSFRRYVRKYGLPQAVYLDRHSTYKSNVKPTLEDELRNRRPQSQFERAMTELGVVVIHATSPQAKGRVERLFRTFQDRLVKEMRLEKISKRAEANRFLVRYLPKYNRRFCVPSAREADVHRRVHEGTDLNSVLSIREKRVVRKDGTVAFEGGLYQIKNPGRLSKVMVERRINGRLRFSDRGRGLSWQRIARRPPGGRAVSPSKSKKPAQKKRQSPWRQFNTYFYSQQSIDKLKRELASV